MIWLKENNIEYKLWPTKEDCITDEDTIGYIEIFDDVHAMMYRVLFDAKIIESQTRIS